MTGLPASGLVLTRAVGELPGGFERLRSEALAEGFDHIERFAAEWLSGQVRFAEDGERLLAAEVDGQLAGIGGVTREPAVPHTLRLRRFYVRAAFRGCGIGRALACELVRHANDLGRNLSLNARTPSACAFWEKLDFDRDLRGLGFTHHRALGPSDSPPG